MLMFCLQLRLLRRSRVGLAPLLAFFPTPHRYVGLPPQYPAMCLVLPRRRLPLHFFLHRRGFLALLVTRHLGFRKIVSVYPFIFFYLLMLFKYGSLSTSKNI